MHEAHIKMTYVSHISTFNYLNYLIIKYTYLTTKIKTIKTKKFTTDHHARDYIKKNQIYFILSLNYAPRVSIRETSQKLPNYPRHIKCTS